MIKIASLQGLTGRLFVVAAAVVCFHLLSAQMTEAEGSRAVLPQGVRSWEKIMGLKGLSNVGMVSPAIFRGAMPESDGYATLKAMGIRTVINLRMTHSEKLDVEDLGMQSVEFPLSVVSDIDAGIVNKIIEIMKDPARQPVYVHCRQGQDRTGIVVAAYRMRVDGWSLKEAEAEMQDYGFNDIWVELKEFIRKYARELGK